MLGPRDFDNQKRGDENDLHELALPVTGSAWRPPISGGAGSDSRSSVPTVVGRRLARASRAETPVNDTAMTIEEGDCPDARGPMMVAQVGAEAICRENRRYSRVRIGDIRMNRQQFAAAIRPISTRGLWNDDVPWTFFGVWDDNYLSIGRDYWMSGHLSLNIRFNQDQVRGLVAVASILPPGGYTDHHAAVAGSYMSLITNESRQVAAEISALVKRLSIAMSLPPDESRQVDADISILTEQMRLIAEKLQLAEPIPGPREGVAQDRSYASGRYPQAAQLSNIYHHMMCILVENAKGE